MSRSYSIVYMGTPEFAVPTLTALHHSAHRVIGVVTQPDRPKGRGRRLAPPPVKVAAEAFGYPVRQPKSIKSDPFFDEMQALQPDLFVVVAMGQILPIRLLTLPPLGAINVHASLLPRLRGAAPIQWAIINGEPESGVTTIQMDAGLDTGDLLLTARTPISDTDTAQSLHDRLAPMGADLLIETLARLADGNLQPEPQQPEAATLAPMLSKNDGRIDWHRSSIEIDRLVRGLTPWPGAFTFCNERRLRLFRTRPLPIKADAAPGTIVQGFADELSVATGDGVLSILEIQGASGKRLAIKDFLCGCDLCPGTVFS
ncbi:MAG: methionyl-tRNA formyltransferase [Desulfosarcinaceae bacterium]|nr:methionyl-tRNA formyltransferase [Desulfosarcinaceae bacterium]